VSYFAQFLGDPRELLTLILATAGGAFALWRWTIDQRWRRVLHEQSLIEKFFASDALREITIKNLPPLKAFAERVLRGSED